MSLLLAGPAAALVFELPGPAALSAETTEPLDSVALPTGPWRDGQLKVFTAEGAVSRQAWILPGASLTSLQIMTPLRDALSQAGYEILYECKDEICGGFDFRYALMLLPEPEMHVDLGDFRYLAAAPEVQNGRDFVSLTVSRSADAGYVHITRIGEPVPVSAPQVQVSTIKTPELESIPSTRGVGALLESDGRAILDDLRFATGSAELEDVAFPTLIALATWLRRIPEAQVVLVGHSDAEGALDRNITLSRRRAASVRQRLLDAHGIAPGRVTAEGVGFLAPRASNATADGRALNRRVEVIRMSP